ncbi:hypothetical protein KC906_02855, partial [Candidatus Kaiserbacteria bacterium]|nr:hypothetical protein [Candidatus Kaiserbacteria bacterium]
GGGGGGGGGGSSRPRCEFLASDKDITSGEEITLSWETTRGREVVIYEGDEDDDNKIYETDDDDEVDEGAIRVRPTEDTKYTLVVSRGSSDRNCVVRIDVDDDEVVLGSARVAGIALTEVPYTGFEAGPFLTFVFYALLTLWGLFVAYTLVIREERVFGFALPGALSRGRILTDDVSTDNGATSDMPEAAQYVSSVVTPARNTTHVAGAPANLPTGNYEPVIGYAALTETNDTETETSDEMTELEDRAHEQKVLLSSDAMRHLVSVCPGDINRLVYLDQVIAEAKISYPTEDGWLVLNLDRMCELTKKRKGNALTVEQTAVVAEKLVEVPVGAGSLAEAIVTGNINAAYQMIGHRPMIALADAAADLDNVFRARKGEQVFISNLLAKETTG